MYIFPILILHLTTKELSVNFLYVMVVITTKDVSANAFRLHNVRIFPKEHPCRAVVLCNYAVCVSELKVKFNFLIHKRISISL